MGRWPPTPTCYLAVAVLVCITATVHGDGDQQLIGTWRPTVSPTNVSLPPSEVKALLAIADDLDPVSINTLSIVDTWINGTNPCQWVGAYGLTHPRCTGASTNLITQVSSATALIRCMTTAITLALLDRSGTMCMASTSRGSRCIESMAGLGSWAPSLRRLAA